MRLPESVRRKVLGFGLFGGTLALAFACGSDPPNVFSDPVPDAAPDGPDPSLGLSDAPDCEGLRCQQVDCGGSTSTTITGTVFAPNGTLPLYNAIVYVPQEPIAPLQDQVQCDRCGTVSGRPLVSTLSKTDGTFELRDMPVGRDIPLVIQVGKWRRQVTIPAVERCATTELEPELTRLPKKKSEGDIPRIAVTTGWCDNLACLLPKLGLDPSEFTASDGDGRLHVYRGATHRLSGVHEPAPAPTGTPSAASSLYSSVSSFSKYDMVMLSCECGTHSEDDTDSSHNGHTDHKTSAQRDALYEYLSRGGRVFASHFHWWWAQETPLEDAADFIGQQAPLADENLDGPFEVEMGQDFEKGRAFAQWLVSTGATNTLGRVPISQPRNNVRGVNASGQRWIYSDELAGEDATQYVSINAPVGEPAAEQCGKFVFAGMHLYAGDIQPKANAQPDDSFPESCSKDLTPEEKALAFLFFDLSSCIQDDREPPRPPVN